MLVGDSLLIMMITNQRSHILNKSGWIQHGMLLPSPFLRAVGGKSLPQINVDVRG